MVKRGAEKGGIFQRGLQNLLLPILVQRIFLDKQIIYKGVVK
jgi:hypothetical protein